MNTERKIVYGCYPSFLSVYFVNYAIEKYNIKFDTILISKKPVCINGRKVSGIKGLLWFFKRFNIKYCLYQAILSSNFLFKFSKKKFLSFEMLAKKHRINIIYSSNFNDYKTIAQLNTREVNFFVSFGLDQILRKTFLNVFENTVNIHPSDLPNFKGPDSVFYFLISGEKSMGITLHKLEEEIDSGDILLRDEIEKLNGDTHLSLLKKSILKGTELFNELLHNQESIIPINQNLIETVYPYKSWPSKEEIKYFQEKNRYLKFKDFI
ncbi:MAG: formyltransferase family protein [Limnohabitans sp.]|nr:formyltransferase family protein [Limnohabitans sp.]